MNTCEQAGNNPDYLIAQNGDSRKTEIAQAKILRRASAQAVIADAPARKQAIMQRYL